MLKANEERILALIDDPDLAQQVLAVIRADEQQRREALMERQSLGLQQARERGVKLGRPRSKKPKKFAAVYEMYQRQQVSARAAAQMLAVSPGTFKRWCQEEEG